MRQGMVVGVIRMCYTFCMEIEPKKVTDHHYHKENTLLPFLLLKARVLTQARRTLLNEFTGCWIPVKF